MSEWLQLAAAILASFRLTESFLYDEVWSPVRRWFPRLPWKCPRCTAVWAGAIWTAFYLVEPWLNWPLLLSWLYFIAVDWKTEWLKRNKVLSSTSKQEEKKSVMDLNPDFVSAIIGSKEIELVVLRMRVTELERKLAELSKPVPVAGDGGDNPTSRP